MISCEQCCKDPAVVGDYDVLLTFADQKAKAFFTQHGFTDDPIIASRYRCLCASGVCNIASRTFFSF